MLGYSAVQLQGPEELCQINFNIPKKNAQSRQILEQDHIPSTPATEPE
jgi:hypothetical protein